MAANSAFDKDTLDAAADLIAPKVHRGALQPITVGFVALVDCAPLIVARHKGFAEAEGIELTLTREPSWANIRDRVVLGHFEAAHMLAPMPIAATLGLGQVATAIAVPLVLNIAGNGISVTTSVYRAMQASGDPGSIDQPATSGRALKRVVDARKAAGEPPLCFGMTYPFSSHNYELRYWLAAAGIDPELDVRLIVVPPPRMVETMAAGDIDGYCVGAPWPTMAVEAGMAHMVATTIAMKPSSPEKVLGVRAAWAERNPALHGALVRAVAAACAWCEDPEHVDELTELLSQPEHVNAPAALIRRALTGRLVTAPGAEATHIPGYLRFAGAGANRPRVADALWYATQMVRWHQTGSLDRALDAARSAFRPDLYDRALGPEANTMDAPDGPFALFDGIRFDPDDPAGYLARLAGRPA